MEWSSHLHSQIFAKVMTIFFIGQMQQLHQVYSLQSFLSFSRARSRCTERKEIVQKSVYNKNRSQWETIFPSTLS